MDPKPRTIDTAAADAAPRHSEPTRTDRFTRSRPPLERDPTEHARLSVGGAGCTIQGFTNVHIQCAVDRLAMLGGGTVELSAGVFHMADSLHLRSGVCVRGQGRETVLRKNAMKQARVMTFLGFGHDDLVVDHPEVFDLGDGILIGDGKAEGFYQTVGTLVRRSGETWFTSRRHAHDYRRKDGGFVKTLFPVISAVDVVDASVQDLCVDGNDEQNDAINGCRGAGFFAHGATRVSARRVAVHRFHGEGFAFQTCEDLALEGCTAEACRGNGFHPGSGSVRFHLHGCAARRCGASGLFYCLAVRDGVLEDSVFEDNVGHGISIGDRDTGHLNRRLVIRRNGGCGVYLRPGDRFVAAHDNTISHCTIQDNAATMGEAEVVLQGEARGVRVVDNVIRRRAGKPGVLILPEMPPFELHGNDVAPAGEGAVVDRRPAEGQADVRP